MDQGKEVIIKIMFDEAQLDQICEAIKSAASLSQLDIGFHEKTPGMKELTDAIKERG